MDVNGWEMVGVYPTYVLQPGAFLAGAFFSQKSAPFHKNVFFLFFLMKPINRSTSLRLSWSLILKRDM